MGLLEKLRFHAWDALGMTTSLINAWKPDGCTTEKQYEISLYNYLHSQLPDFNITKQYARGRLRVDLAIEEKLFIELKTNLNTTSKYQRLVGQCTDYVSWSGPLIIVLTGDTDIDLGKKFNKYLQKEGLIEDDRVRVIEK